MQQVYQIAGESFEDIVAKMEKIVNAYRGAPAPAAAPTPIETYIDEASRAAPEPKRRGRPSKADAPKADAPESSTEDKELTADDAREAAKFLVGKKGMAAVQTILFGFDADRVSALDPKHYAQFIADCRTMAGEAA